MSVMEETLRSEQDYRQWLVRFSVRLLVFSAGAVLLTTWVLLRDEVNFSKLFLLVACALAIALFITSLPWHRMAAHWFLGPVLLTGLVTVGLLRISGGAESPFRLLPVAILLFAVAYFERGGPWIGLGMAIGIYLMVPLSLHRDPGLSRQLVEGLCLLLIALIAGRTIHALRVQRLKIIQLNDRIEQQRAQVVAATQTQTMMQLAGGVAHQLNQPLTVLLAESERLQRSPHLPADLKEPLGYCFTAAQKATQIVQQLQQLTTHATAPYVGGMNISDVSASSSPHPRGGPKED